MKLRLILKVRHHREEHVGVFVMDQVVALNRALTTQKKRMKFSGGGCEENVKFEV